MNDINEIGKILSAINIKENNDIDTSVDYFHLCRLYADLNMSKKWEYPRLSSLSPFPLKAIEELIDSIEEKSSNGVITEDCYDDITMLAVIFSHLSNNADEEYHFSEFDCLLDSDKLTDTDKINVLKNVFCLYKSNLSKEQFLTLSHVLCFLIL